MLNKIYVFCLLFLVACSDGIKSDHPNILMISIDDLNDWVGIYDGHPNSYTPNIDKLGSNAVVFKNAYSQSPLCGPSRASILTGLRPTSSGIYGQINDNQLRDFSTKNDVFLMPEFFYKLSLIVMTPNQLPILYFSKLLIHFSTNFKLLSSILYFLCAFISLVRYDS